VAILVLAVAGRLAGAASFEAYPSLHVAMDPGTPALCAALIAATLLPFCDRRGIEP